MGIVFSESSGLNDSIFGKSQAPVQLFLEKRGEDWEKKSVLKHVFRMGTTKKPIDRFTSLTAMDGFQPVGENGAYPQDSMQEGYHKDLDYETWKDAFSITKEAMEDSVLIDFNQRPAAFMSSYYRTRERFGAGLYAAALKGNSSFSFKGKTFDALAADGSTLFNIAHTPKVSGGSQSNKFSNEFSRDALGAAESRMHTIKGDNGEILDVAPDTILIPDEPNLKNAVFAAIGSPQDPTTANNAFNYQYGRWTVIIWTYLNEFITAGTKPWILLDSLYNKTYAGAVWNDRVPLTVRSTIDENTDANVWRGRARFNATFNDWRFACAGGISGGTDILA